MKKVQKVTEDEAPVENQAEEDEAPVLAQAVPWTEVKISRRKLPILKDDNPAGHNFCLTGQKSKELEDNLRDKWVTMLFIFHSQRPHNSNHQEPLTLQQCQKGPQQDFKLRNNSSSRLLRKIRLLSEISRRLWLFDEI